MIAIFKIFINKYKLYRFRKIWRKKNSKNQTVAINIFNYKIVKVGLMSYGRLEIYGWEAENEGLLIGDYVSIADEVKFILGGNHHYKSFSNYPFKVKLRIQKNEAYSNGPIIVEDDVWIGMGSTILSGVRIGKGSVIAAGSVIVKDVEPYSIVGGNPAKQIKMRFDKDLITKIKDFNLRDLDLEIVKKNIDIFYENLDEKNIETITKIF